MAITSQDQTALKTLESRVRAILPEQYQDCYDNVTPASMGSAGLKYRQDGTVAWDQMWATFCDLAMAGGPPHKGALLEPASQTEIEANCDRYRRVVQEICRGIEMLTDLAAESSSTPGWIRVECINRVTAEWLLRAITTENVSVRCHGAVLELPAGPWYRLDKEIKNVITVVAKTCHYWFGHTSQAQRMNIRNLFAKMELEQPLLQPATLTDAVESGPNEATRDRMAEMVHKLTGLQTSNHRYPGWLGAEYPDVRSAIWMMRALVASNVLSRREGAVLFVPIDPIRDRSGEVAVRFMAHLKTVATVRGIL